LLVGDQPETFARAVIRLLNGNGLPRGIGRSALCREVAF
jgi:hypothetical protein